VPNADTPYLTQDADVLATKHDARIFATELHGTLNIPKADDHTPNTAIVTYKTPDGRTLFVDFMGTLIGLTNEEIRKTAVEFEHPDYGLIRVLHPTLVLKSRIVNLHRLQSKRDSNGIEQARLAVPVAKAFFENYVSTGLAGKNPDRYLIDRVMWLGKLALSDAGIYVHTQWEIDVMAAAPAGLIANKNSTPNIGHASMRAFAPNGDGGISWVKNKTWLQMILTVITHSPNNSTPVPVFDIK
jgi:hypothetical protein